MFLSGSEYRNQFLDRRRRELRLCTKLGKEAVAFDPEALDKRLRFSRIFTDKYDTMGRYARQAFIKPLAYDDWRILASPSQGGFMALARILGTVPDSAEDYTKTGSQPDSDNLRAALKDSTDTVGKLTQLPSRSNQEAEVGLGLAVPRNLRAANHFKFEDTELGLRFLLDEDIYKDRTTPLLGSGPLEVRRQRCPAHQLIINHIWPAMVDLAFDTPRLFPKDLKSVGVV